MPLRGTACKPAVPGATRFLFRHIAGPDDVRTVLEEVVRGIPGPLSADRLATLELVLAEVLNNIVEHAFSAQSPGRVAIEVTCTASGLTCDIRDNGRAMPGETLPDGHLPDLGVSNPELPEGGFGWHLIRSLTSDLAYRRTAEGNALRFTLPAD